MTPNVVGTTTEEVLSILEGVYVCLSVCLSVCLWTDFVSAIVQDALVLCSGTVVSFPLISLQPLKLICDPLWTVENSLHFNFFQFGKICSITAGGMESDFYFTASNFI